MNRTATTVALIGLAAGALVLSACSGSSSGGSSSATGGGQRGGTLTILTNAEQFQTLDPQVVYTGEDQAFFGATIMRSLTTYKVSSDDKEGTTLVPDMATDTGTESNGAKTWKFTLRDGLMWEDGKPVTCADVAYGVSRQFDVGLTNGGPIFAVTYLDIPTDEEGNSLYQGPSGKTGQDLFDKAVTCDGNTITFNLNQAVPDFNYAVSLGFSPVPAGLPAGDEYANKPISNGPYKIQEYTKGPGGQLVLVRNENWSAASDPFRKALPDSWVVKFGIEDAVAEQRVMQSSGDDAYAMVQAVSTASLAVIFNDPQYESRRTDALDIYTNYVALNTKTIPDKRVRQAIAVALDRDAIIKNAGGTFAGTYADGAVKPNIGIDYAPTGLWEGLLGQPVPGSGDPEFAKRLLAEAGVTNLTLRYDYAQSEDADKGAAIWVESLARAGITIKPNPIEFGVYYTVVNEEPGDIMTSGWGSDWPNASTVIPPLFVAGWNLSQVDDSAFAEKVAVAQQEVDRNEQATMWQALNKEAAEQMWIVPITFGRSQKLVGAKVAPVFNWAAYGSLPYPEMYAIQ